MSHFKKFISDCVAVESRPTFTYAEFGMSDRGEREFEKLMQSFDIFETHTGVIAIVGDIKVRLTHAALGMSSEVPEYQDACLKSDDINVMEELGDILWYWAIAIDTLKLNPWRVHQAGKIAIEPLENNTISAEEVEKVLVYHIGQFADLAKKHAMYNRELDVAAAGFELAMVIRAVEDLLVLRFGRNGEHTLETTMARNTDKLRKKRFKNGYSDEAANNRDTDEERKALEGE
jgi:NTP pyrophosphatase (non-canonical NTP hydrolase)